jgi:hypothetical protein
MTTTEACKQSLHRRCDGTGTDEATGEPVQCDCFCHRLQVHRLPSDFVERGYREAFGETREDAKDKRVCVSCKQHPTFTTEAGRREYEISGLCEPCFDRIALPPDEPA